MGRVTRFACLAEAMPPANIVEKKQTTIPVVNTSITVQKIKNINIIGAGTKKTRTQRPQHQRGTAFVASFGFGGKTPLRVQQLVPQQSPRPWLHRDVPERTIGKKQR